VLADRLLRRVGLNGQGLIPLILGFSCVAAAVITTRMLPTRKERIILTLLVVGLPCAPLLAVMVVILGKMPWTASAVVFGVIFARLLAAGYVSSKVLGGPRPDFILEIPPMRIPRVGVLMAKTWRRTWDFVREAVPVFLAASFAMFLFARAGGLAAMEEAAQPLVRDLLGLPDQAVQVFIKTAIRREAGATELNLLRDQFDHLQLVVTLLVMTLLLPCVNTAIVIVKERGLKAASVVLVTVILSAFLIGAAVNGVCHALGVAFT
jgi:ferrous iron transport protein B